MISRRTWQQPHEKGLEVSAILEAGFLVWEGIVDSISSAILWHLWTGRFDGPASNSSLLVTVGIESCILGGEVGTLIIEVDEWTLKPMRFWGSKEE